MTKIYTYADAVNKIFEQYRQVSKAFQTPFNLSHDEVKQLMLSDCHFCGMPPSNAIVEFDGEFRPDIAMVYSGITRRSLMEGFTAENCIACCAHCAHAKGSYSEQQFTSWIREMYLKTFKYTSHKTVGMLVDELTTAVVKCFYAQEKVMQAESETEKAEAGEQAQRLNRKRNDLIRALDAHFNELEGSPTEKTY